MPLKAKKTSLKEILHFRHQYLQENNFQIRYDACHERGWSDSYLLSDDRMPVGYGSVKGKGNLADRDAVFEFYLLPHHRRESNQFYHSLLTTSQARFMECQTNDFLHAAMVFEFGKGIRSDTILFSDHSTTRLQVPNAEVRLRRDSDIIFEKYKDPGAYVLLVHEEVVASAGFLLHYNMPFADLYMEVRPDFRGHGYGAYILQEVKKHCYAAGRVPAARCSIKNPASRASLLNAGLRICGYMLWAKFK